MNEFKHILGIIYKARNRAFEKVNEELINLYWQVGEHLYNKLETKEWGSKVIDKLAKHIKEEQPQLKGFNRRGLYRMKQFYETYKDQTDLIEMTRKVSWTHNLIIMSSAKTIEGKEFYLRLSAKERYSKRELDRQIASGFFERTMLSNEIVSPVVTQFKESYNVSSVFKDTYLFEFLDLPEKYTENDLKKALIENLKQFILELGKGFAFMGSEYRLQVGMEDYYIDLLFYHRELQCMVCFELKLGKFHPKDLGQVNFYLEALDRDVKLAHENPSVGIILCSSKDKQVVEYALSRSLSPTLVSEYKTKLIPKILLEQKMQELFQYKESEEDV